MKLPLLFPLLALSLPSILHAGDPVFDIPRIEHKEDLITRGFHVEALASDTGEAGHAEFSMGWDDKGLVVHIVVQKNSPIIKADEDKELGSKDSVEIFFGAKKELRQYYELTTITGVLLKDGDGSKMRVLIDDLRNPAPELKPNPVIEGREMSGEFKDGYYVDVLLPWSDLGITPNEGVEASFQLCVNSVDAAGQHKSTATWHPGYRVHEDPNAMYRIRLATKASPPVRLAVRASLDRGQRRVDIAAALELAYKPVQVKAGDKIIATGVLASDAMGIHAAFLVPAFATDISVEGAGREQIDFANLPDLVTAGVLNMRPVFKPCVFSGEKFPACELDPAADTEKTLGKCTLIPTFYDSSYNEVKTAARPGRYGAIVHVETASGQKFNRYVTLYRAQDELLGRTLRLHFSSVELPKELGIDPVVVATRIRSVGDFFGDQFRTSAGMSRGADAAILLAWLSDSTPGPATPDLERNGPNAADQKWWYGLKKKTGNLRTDYFVHLPPGYDKDPQKKWPVILFLHGSGERGYDLKILARQPLPGDIDDRKDFPFIVVAPQVSPGEWWCTQELDDLLDRLPAKYRIDPDRIYLTGLSMGGFASWAYAAAEPGRFAAIVPICGGGDPEDVAPFKNVPIWVFHGAKDDAVPIQRSQEMVDALKKLGGNVKFTIFPDDGHVKAWKDAYAMPELYEWLLQQKREVK